ncbi:kinase-like protein [Rhizophagus irregularis]|uniref:Kinase-like protein n=1 Tax=Rhizophagus irregularis TaxID=588596 RepID=A0A2I1G6Q0_9GLOM|nr:kinase-like protein [Rhizophagus irregularis]
MWEISSGYQPFCGEDYDVSLALAILDGRREKFVDGTPSAYSNLYKECWKYEPDERPDIQKVVLTLKPMISPENNDTIMDNNNEEIDNCEMDKLASKSCELMMNFDDCSLSSLNNTSSFKDVPIGSISSQSIIPNIVRVDKAYSTKIALETIINLGKSVEPYLPLITETTLLIKQTVESYESAQYNKKSCAVLIQRVQAAEVALNHCNQGNKKNFCKQSYYHSFERFVAVLREIKGFIQDVTHLSGYRKFISNDNIKVRFQQLITDFDSIVGDLQLIMIIANKEKRRKDIDILQKDINEMTKFLEKINGGVTTSDKKISNIFEYIITLKGKSPEKGFNPIINRIEPEELGGNQPVVSSRKIHKKLYRGQDVACKFIAAGEFYKLSKIKNRVRTELAILSNLGKCNYIINFHGLCEKDGSIFSVFEWTENGNLRELYEKFDIEWPRKLKIALNICRGITFLHGCQILHHNIRCENILITENLEPKISNFEYSHVLRSNRTYDIGKITQIIRWLAPEKMDSGNSYTIQCDIFSFGMLLWELAFQRFPYKDMEIDEIRKYVLSGKREHLKFPSSSYGVEKEYGNIIRAAWLSDPSLRPELSCLFNSLEDLNSPFISDRSPRGLNPKRSDMEVTHIDLPSGDTEFDLDQIDFILPLEDGMKAHRMGDKKKAFECFEKHAKIDNKIAKYRLGVYYWEGYVVEKNLGKAAELIKEAADKGVSNAQLRYAFILLDQNSPLEFNLEEFVKYLTMAADNGSTVSQFNLGDLYYNGRLGISKDEEKGLSYLKLAAIKGFSKACDMLDKLKISYFDF